jgi:hypothetical protein
MRVCNTRYTCWHLLLFVDFSGVSRQGDNVCVRLSLPNSRVLFSAGSSKCPLYSSTEVGGRSIQNGARVLAPITWASGGNGGEVKSVASLKISHSNATIMHSCYRYGREMSNSRAWEGWIWRWHLHYGHFELRSQGCRWCTWSSMAESLQGLYWGPRHSLAVGSLFGKKTVERRVAYI